jgi:hypothetical protein
MSDVGRIQELKNPTIQGIKFKVSKSKLQGIEDSRFKDHASIEYADSSKLTQVGFKIM